MTDARVTPASAAVISVEAPSKTAGLLRLTTAGSVDDGKSTLIGRLLYETQAAYEDQVESLRNSRFNRSCGPIDFSLLTDGLRAEREQGITIDVAYRYFSTQRRKFIIADAPGHEQYTRNMATGASTADAAIILLDVKKGVLAQSRRHAYIAYLLAVRHVIFAVNKMDTAAYDRSIFRRVEAEVRFLAERLEFTNAYVIPISALEGDNVVRHSKRMPWFDGPAILERLETIPLNDSSGDLPFRFPVQYVIRPDRTFRGFAGQIASGTVSKGDRVIALPSGRTTRVQSIVTFDDEIQKASFGDSICLTLEDEIDLSRGDLLASVQAPAVLARHIRAHVVWMHHEPLDCNRLYLIKHTTRTARARITNIAHRIDMDSLEQVPTEALQLNDIATVDLEASLPLAFDSYRVNRITGSFILIDPISNATVAAGMIDCALRLPDLAQRAITTQPVSERDRYERFGHSAAAVWLGNERLALQLERWLFDRAWLVQQVDLSEFKLSETEAIARLLHETGAITIFLALTCDELSKTTVQKVFGSSAFFAFEGESIESIVLVLQQWRTAATSDSPEKNDE